MNPCPLCFSSDFGPAWNHRAWPQRPFQHCRQCDAVFVSEKDQVSFDAERARYATHKNDASAAGYVDFLNETVRMIRERLPRGSRILDFGSGPSPLMSRLLREAGYEVVSYDPFFQPDPVAGPFDLVLAHEVFEHLRRPADEIARIKSWLNDDGLFLIRSEPRPDPAKFADWWYARDFTHIFFASEKTLRWIADRQAWTFAAWSPKLWSFNRKTSG